jgi:hypothetical protein
MAAPVPSVLRRFQRLAPARFRVADNKCSRRCVNTPGAGQDPKEVLTSTVALYPSSAFSQVKDRKCKLTSKDRRAHEL